MVAKANMPSQTCNSGFPYPRKRWGMRGLLCLCLLLTSCASTQPVTPAPPTVQSIDQKIAVGLADAAAVIQGLEPLVTKYPGLKDPLNRAIAVYTTLKASAKTFDDAVTSGANPDPTKIQADMQSLLTSLAGLKATYP